MIGMSALAARGEQHRLLGQALARRCATYPADLFEEHRAVQPRLAAEREQHSISKAGNARVQPGCVTRDRTGADAREENWPTMM